MDKTCIQSMEVVKEVINLVSKNPNDGTLGKKIREYIRNLDNGQGTNKKD